MVECLIAVAAFSSRAFKDWCARNMRESVVRRYPYATVISMITSEGFPGGSHASRVSTCMLARPMVPCFGLLILGVWFWGTDADLNPWGVKWAVLGCFWLGPLPMHGTVIVALAILSPCGMHEAVWSLLWSVNGTVWAAVGPCSMEGAVCCRVCFLWVKGAFSGALVSCRGMNGAIDGTWGV